MASLSDHSRPMWVVANFTPVSKSLKAKFITA